MTLTSRSRPAGLFTRGAAILCGLATTLALAAPAMADPVYGAMNASGGIYWRSAADWNTPEAIAGNGFYNGTSLQIHCYVLNGSAVPGSNDTTWEYASVAGGQGSGSGYVNEHFINDGQPINQPSPGVPACGSAPAPPAPPPAPTPPPSGAPSFSGSGPNYLAGPSQSPHGTGCDHGSQALRHGAMVDKRTGRTIGYGYLRYSRPCQTEWFTVNYDSRSLNGSPGYYIAPAIWYQNQSSDCARLGCTAWDSPPGGSGTVWTYQLDGRLTVCAGAQVYYATSTGSNSGRYVGWYYFGCA